VRSFIGLESFGPILRGSAGHIYRTARARQGAPRARHERGKTVPLKGEAGERPRCEPRGYGKERSSVTGGFRPRPKMLQGRPARHRYKAAMREQTLGDALAIGNELAADRKGIAHAGLIVSQRGGREKCQREDRE